MIRQISGIGFWELIWNIIFPEPQNCYCQMLTAAMLLFESYLSSSLQFKVSSLKAFEYQVNYQSLLEPVNLGFLRRHLNSFTSCTTQRYSFYLVEFWSDVWLQSQISTLVVQKVRDRCHFMPHPTLKTNTKIHLHILTWPLIAFQYI